MNELRSQAAPTAPVRPGLPDAAAQEEHKKRLLALLNKGLPTLPQYLMDLNALLSSPTVELKRVGKVIRTDPSLSAQILRLCNSALFGLRRRVLSIEQAAVLLGTERLRTLVLTCSVMQLAGGNVPAQSLLGFWQHSFLAALLSERIARAAEYQETEQSYLGGLLHDIGQLPLWMLVMEEARRHRPLPLGNWPDKPAVEREYFGVDHGRVGRWMAVAWNFMPSFMDVFEHHHDPENAKHDPYLVGIVATADTFLQAQEAKEATSQFINENIVDSGAPNSAPNRENSQAPIREEELRLSGEHLPRLSEAHRLAILEMLQTEYIHLLPLVQLGLSSISLVPGSEQQSQERKP